MLSTAIHANILRSLLYLIVCMVRLSKYMNSVKILLHKNYGFTTKYVISPVFVGYDAENCTVKLSCLISVTIVPTIILYPCESNCETVTLEFGLHPTEGARFTCNEVAPCGTCT